MRTKWTSLCLLAVLALSTTAYAQPTDRRTYFTFNQPVALPGVTLPAGTYLFRLADAFNGRRTVNVLDASGRTSLAMLLATPVYRANVTSRPEVQFMPTAHGMPAAIQTWWQPGDTLGYQLVYPAQQAQLLARGADRPALTTASSGDTPTE
jgi:hypothetical protein